MIPSRRLVQNLLKKNLSTLGALDPYQEALLAEKCILVDENDREVGHASKKECHLKTSGNEGRTPLHRAFSLFMFNKNNELLLQQRSDTKVTFPGLWTNTCCSHPLFLNDERETKNGLGAKIAAQRKVWQEIGVPAQACPIDQMQFISRILYYADSDDQWAEHELDYILFLKSNQEKIQLEANPEEVQNVMYLKKSDLTDFVKDMGPEKLTPWFTLMCNSMLPKWWDSLDDLKPFINHDQIIRY